jgi:hypothetical protein
LISIEGQPVAGATVSVFQLDRADGEKLDQWNELAREKPLITTAKNRMMMSEAGAYYGRSFEFVTQPSLPVFGVVRDIETKAPLAGVPVAIGSVYGARMSHTGYVVTRTDDQGRYRIEGLPIPPKGTRKWDRNGLSVRPGHLPYIENDHIPIPVGDGVDPVEFNVELRRAVTARGRITNELTGEPIMAALYYTPFRSNEHTDKYMRYADDLTTMLGNDTRYHSDEEGNFEIPVIPGRGVVTAKVSDSGDLVSGYGKAEIDEFKNNQGGLTPGTSDHLVLPLFHCIKEIDVPEKVIEFDVAMHVRPGESLTVRFVDPDGKPLEGVAGSGHDSRRLQ